MHHAGFLPGNESPPAVGKRDQDRWRSEVEIGTVRIRTVALVGQPAGGVPGVCGRCLAGPKDLTGVQVECHERIAGRGGRIAIVISSGDVDGIALDVDCRACPNGRSGWTPHLCAGPIFLRGPRFLGDRVGPPDLFAAGSIQRDQAAPETAALVSGRRSRVFFAGGNAHVESAIVKYGRTGDAGERIIIDFCFPQQPAIRRINGVNVGGAVTDECREARPRACFHAADADGGTHGSSGLKKPVDAACSSAERVDVAALAADKNAASGDGGLRVSSHITGIAKRPLEFQERHFGSGQPGAILKARIGRVDAPSVPGRPSQWVAKATGRGAAHGRS